MDDHKIVELYWARAEAAIEETQKKYGNYCHTIAYNILDSHQDAQECVNDTYIRAWDAMPPQKPTRLKAFLAKITRNLALNRYDYNRAQKRDHHTEVILDEFWECIDTGEMAPADEYALKEAINSFLGSLPQHVRIMFLRRYWYLCSVKEIAQSMGLTESNVKVTLLRARSKFKEHLKKEGILI